MRLALVVLLFPFFAGAASLTGSLVDPSGTSVAHALVELVSGAKNYQAQTDDAGSYQFAALPAGEYTLTFKREWFRSLIVKSIGLSEQESKRIPEITLTPYPDCPHYPPNLDFVRPILDPFARLSGTVLPAAPDVTVVLICRTFRSCGSTKTDSSGHFSFEMLSAGTYGLSFHRDGFFDQDAIAYEYYVNAGVESVYAPVRLEPCPGGNCEAKIQRILPACE